MWTIAQICPIQMPLERQIQSSFLTVGQLTNKL